MGTCYFLSWQTKIGEGGIRMKDELKCSVVQDLLPNYIEKLTSNDTNNAIEQHLNNCEDCKKSYELMAADIGNIEKVPMIELKFLKKVKRTRLMSAVLCFVLTLILSYLIYDSEYKFKNDKSDLAKAVTEYTASSQVKLDAYILETKEKDGALIVSFKDQSNLDVNGIAVLLKGFNQKYRIVQANIDSSNYSAVVQIFPIKIKDKQYCVVSAYSLTDEIKYYGLDYWAYTNSGYLSKDRVRKTIKFDVKNQQFLEIYQQEELDKQLENSAGVTLYNYHLVETSIYDSIGSEITDNFKIQEIAKNRVSSNIYKAELFVLYVFIAIVMALGFILARYFLI